MANKFKSDDSFLRKLVIGAAGTNTTIDRLKTMGFNPIELERGSTGFKIWKKIKIKRVRVPDILCLNTGMRFESRGKTKLEISRWISYIIGYGKDNFVQADLEAICSADPEVYFAASVLWQIMDSWVNNLEEY